MNKRKRTDEVPKESRNWTDEFKVSVGFWKSKIEKEYFFKRAKRTCDYALDLGKKEGGQDFYKFSQNGDELLKDLRNHLNNLPITRSEGQKKFHDEFMRAVASGLYREKWNSDYMRILKENNWSDPKSNTIIVTPRRFGKTTAVAAFVAAYALAVPGGVQSIFSTGKRVSQMLLEQIKKFLIHMGLDSKRIMKSSEETIWILGNDPTDIRKVYSYPSNPNVRL